MASSLARIRQLDAFPKVDKDFYSRSLSGGFITLISVVVMVLLFVTELSKSPFLFSLFSFRLLLLFSFHCFIFAWFCFFDFRSCLAENVKICFCDIISLSSFFRYVLSSITIVMLFFCLSLILFIFVSENSKNCFER